MRKILFLTFLFSTSLFANSFDLANKYYTEKQFHKALEIYLDLTKKTEPTANLYYNIGNCYYRLNQIGNAILFYEKALKINPDDESIQKNLKIANTKTIDRITPVSKIFLYQWYDDLIQKNSPKFFSISSIVFIWVSIGFAILFFITKLSNIRKFSFYLSLISFFLFFVMIWFGYQSDSFRQQTQVAVLTVQSVYVKSSPDANSIDLFIIHEGTKFELKDNLSDWFKIRLSNGATGWIEEKNFGKI